MENYNIGDSLYDKDSETFVKSLMKYKNKIHLPIDFVASKNIKNTQNIIITDKEISNGYMGLDIGPESIKYFSNILQNTNTIIWNGPLGVFEEPVFATGTKK